MQELGQYSPVLKDKAERKEVTFFIESSFTTLTGTWRWNLHTNQVFCSDVMMSIPAGSIGTRGIIHPDDLAAVKDIISKAGNNTIDYLECRMITTYGEVTTITGENLSIDKNAIPGASLEIDLVDTAAADFQREKELDFLSIANDTYKNTERFTNTGIWFYNAVTNFTWYSNQVYSIYGLPVQSVNAHLNTFHQFIHPEDKDHVVEYINKAYKNRSPLHIEFRIVSQDDTLKHLLYISDWMHNAKGEMILSGTIQDVSHKKQTELELEAARFANHFLKQQVVFDEQHTNTGHWQVNMITRKTIYSDNMYRLFGLKAQSMPAGFNTISKYIHPDDQDMVIAANKKMMHEHKGPDVEFRVIRTDGKLRYMKQRAKIVMYGDEMVMAGVVQDITLQKMLEMRSHEVLDAHVVNALCQKATDEIGGTATWVIDLQTDKETWSDSFYKLLGYKTNTVQLHTKLFQSFIYPEDKKIFQDNIDLVLHHQQDMVFSFRLQYRGSLLDMEAHAQTLEHNEKNYFLCVFKNVTNASLLQKETQQIKQLADALSANVMDRVIVTDYNQNVLVWNDKCEVAYKITKEHAIGENFFDLFPTLKTEAQIQMFNRVFKGEKIAEYSVKSTLGTGYYDLHLLPVWSDEAEIEAMGIIHVIHDVTKEIKLRQSLDDRLSLLSSILSVSDDKIIALDSNMNYLYWNIKAEEHFGLKKEKVVGKNILEVFPSFFDDPSYPYFAQALKGKTVHLPAQASEDGINAEVYLVPVKNDKDKVTSVLWLMRDRQKEYLLAEQEGKARMILQAINENCFELNKEFRITYVNPKTEAYYGKKLDEVKGLVVWDVLPQIVGTPFYHAIVKSMEEAETISGKFISPVSGKQIYASLLPTANGILVLFLENV